ncbi:putative cyclic nucleotide-binding domain protein [Desulfosarcina variabilis str. Montpellier]|uniref:Crp/Fnr family transcriptional regulator n=1 Tax=Desulfosarcina variabilis TaxID=2300 RepID=UPI003AFACDF5
MVSPQMLTDLSFFEELSESMIKRLACLAEIKTYPEGEFLNKKRKEANFFYILLEGEISLEVESLTGKTVRLETIAPGAAMGFSSLIDMAPKRYLSDARALTPVKILRFPSHEMSLLFYQDFELGYLIMKKIAWVAKQRLINRTYPVEKP